jgi:hypothetical protein
VEHPNHQAVARVYAAKEDVMTDRSNLSRQANELRQQAELEADEQIRDRLLRMADHYAHLAESQADSEAHPPGPESLAEIFTKRD